jgi:para-nitrobenzyl esterase
MVDPSVSCRGLLVGGADRGLLLTLPMSSWAQAVKPTAPVEALSGKVRGTKVGGISRFLGISYDRDTSRES